MLQILMLGIGVLIVGVGYCGQQLAKLNRKNKEKDTDGNGFFILMLILAAAFALLSFLQIAALLNFKDLLLP